MESTGQYTHTQYLRAKASVDAQSLHAGVWNAFTAKLNRIASSQGALTILEVGAGIGTSAQWILDAIYSLDTAVEVRYIAVDKDEAAIEEAKSAFKGWARNQEGRIKSSVNSVQVEGRKSSHVVQLISEDIFSYLEGNEYLKADVVVAQAFLDLFNLEYILNLLAYRAKHLLYFPINFDGVTGFTPEIGSIDNTVERAYHRSMERRESKNGPIGGSKSGRRILQCVVNTDDLQLIEAGPSDWLVYPRNHEYTEAERYFIDYMLHTIEQELKSESEILSSEFYQWIEQRREHLQQGKLTFMTHQLDILAKKS
jgi:SAM-dependent methyltransferase